MNNKGQTLVAFILLLPIITLLIAYITDIGMLSLKKQKYETEIQDSIEYGLKNIEEDNIENKIRILLDKNIEGIKKIRIQDKTITITVKEKNKGFFQSVSKEKYSINITRTGQIENDKIIIE